MMSKSVANEQDSNDNAEEQGASVAERAFGRILQEGMDPTPEMYRVWHVYYAKTNPEVMHAIDTAERAGQKITQEFCNQIYKLHLTEENTTLLMHQASGIVQKTIEAVSGTLNDAKKATSNYGNALSGFHGKMHDNMSVQDVQAMIAPIMSETQGMLEENKRLEDELAESSETMEELRRELEMVRREALTDSLTGVSNRKAFDVAIKRLIDDARRKERHSRSSCLISIILRLLTTITVTS